jgi:outer membrane protein OmpA-like peptidoglycan-associated protein
MIWFKALGSSALAIAVLALPLPAAADAPLVTVEASAGKALTAPQSDRFGFGGALAVAAYGRVAPWLLLGAKLRAGALMDGDPPSESALVDPGVGTFQTLSGMLRLRPFASGGDPRSGVGFFVEGGGGGTLTGTLVRPHVEAGLGYGIAAGDVAIAPTARYVQVVQSSDPLSDEDARLLLVGVELAFVDGHREAPAPAVAAPAAVVVAAPADTDGDGVLDGDDACKTEPEDKDGYQDDDGCPERDNDGDRVADADDKCPNEPEDFDAFEDDDGCPEADNDRDGFADADDKCPLEAEVVNGNQDYDGCPDQGVIELHGDRVVLEEEVIFDSGRVRVKTAARAVLDAFVRLYKQHPEWMQIRIEGHADHRGREALNQRLSERRANNVRKALIARGIPEARVEAAGYGSTRPRDKRDDEDAYQRNRRVEFVVSAPAGAAGGER